MLSAPEVGKAEGIERKHKGDKGIKKTEGRAKTEGGGHSFILICGELNCL